LLEGFLKTLDSSLEAHELRAEGIQVLAQLIATLHISSNFHDAIGYPLRAQPHLAVLQSGHQLWMEEIPR
jgi:hypothetical protein